MNLADRLKENEAVEERKDESNDNKYLNRMLEREKQAEALEKLDSDWESELGKLKEGENKDTWNALDKQGFLDEKTVKEVLHRTKSIATTASEILKTAENTLEMRAKDKEIEELKGKIENPEKKEGDVDNPELLKNNTGGGGSEAGSRNGVIDFTKMDIDKMPKDIQAFAKRTAYVQNQRAKESKNKGW
jgi:hypothetical protein